MRNSDFKIADCLISYNDKLIIKKNKNGEIPLDIAGHFHNEQMEAFLRAIMNFKYTPPLFEVTYLKYHETKNDKERQEVTNDVITMLCERVQNHDLDYEEEEEEVEEVDAENRAEA